MTEQTHMLIGFGLSLIFHFTFYSRPLLKMYKQLKKMKNYKKDIPELADALSFKEFKQNNNQK